MRVSLARLICVTAGALLVATGLARGQAYPNKPVRVVIGYSAGAGNDVIGRLVLAEVSRALGQYFVVDNRPGASGIIGAEIVARSTADGYTLLNAPGSISIIHSLFPQLPYDLLRDLTPIAVMASVPFLLIVHPSFPGKSVNELVAHAKTRPGELTHGSGGLGGGPHLAGELFSMRTGIKLRYIPYKSSAQANADVASGQITMAFSPTPSAIPLVHAQRVRPVAITSVQRHPALPDVPTVAEAALPDFEARNWIALFGPTGMSKNSIARINAEINRVVQTPEMRERFANLGAEPMHGTPAQWDAYVRGEVKKWAGVIKAAGIKLK